MEPPPSLGGSIFSPLKNIYYAFLGLVFFVKYFLICSSFEKEKFTKRNNKVNESCGGSYNIFSTYLLNWSNLVSSGKKQKRTLTKEAIFHLKIGDDAPDSEMYSFESGNRIKLSSLFQSTRPILLNFGSFTWPPWRQESEFIKSIISDFSGKVDVITIYVTEAHAFDEWDLNKTLPDWDDSFCYMQPKTQQQRRNIASDFAKRYDFPTENFYIDTMENSSGGAYCAVPERLYVIKDRKMIYVGGPGPFHYDVKEVRDFLAQWLERSN